MIIKKTYWLLVLAFLLNALSAHGAEEAALIKVACVGDSITFGAGIKEENLQKVIPLLDEVSAETGEKIIDLYKALDGWTGSPRCFPIRSTRMQLVPRLWSQRLSKPFLRLNRSAQIICSERRSGV